jgi:hypothetical protein
MTPTRLQLDPLSGVLVQVQLLSTALDQVERDLANLRATARELNKHVDLIVKTISQEGR